METSDIADFAVAPLTIGEVVATEYRCFFAALGYESRARTVAEELRPRAQRRTAIAFTSPTCIAYADNRTFFGRNGYEIVEIRDEVSVTACASRSIQAEGFNDAEPLRVLIDVSSQTRSWIGQLLSACSAFAIGRTVEIDIIYVLAKYSASDRDELPMRHIGPVSAAFAGWSLDPGRPPAAVVGLGYEKGRALGAVEYLQADESWIFIPKSPISEYLRDVRNANDVLLENTPPRRIAEYDVLDPFETFVAVESLVYGLERNSRPILLPFGPKIFSIVSMLVAMKHETASVWRISSGEPDVPSDRLPSKHMCALRVSFSPQPATTASDPQEM